MTKILIRQPGSKLARLDFCGIVRVAVADVVKQVPEWKKNRIPPELQHVSEFVKNEFDRTSVRWIDWTILCAQIHSIGQRQPGHVSVSRNPPERNASARAKSNLRRITRTWDVDPNPFRQRIR